jgi:hypothetical protein
MNVLMMWRHADPVRHLLSFAMTWSVATLCWFAPILSVCALVWRAPAAAPRGESAPRAAERRNGSPLPWRMERSRNRMSIPARLVRHLGEGGFGR